MESQKQHKTKTKNPLLQDNDTNNGDSEAAMEFEAWKDENDTHRTHIYIAQMNVDRSPDVMIVMQQECLRNTDILLFQ